MQKDIEAYCVSPTASIRDAVARIDATRRGIVLVVDEDGRLVGTVTDGDVRRAMLAGVDFQQPIRALLGQKAGTRFERPVTAPVGAERSTYLQLLEQHNVLHLPIVDAEERVVGLVTLDEFISDTPLALHAVVMAGVLGTRLHPLTQHVPKPMLPIGDQPLLEIIIRQLRDAGIRQVKVTTHSQSEKIVDYFGDGQQFGVELSYVNEQSPLGTAGGLGLVEPPAETMLVINGDILTEVDFRAMLAFHKEHHAELTVGVRHYDCQLPYGVIECEGAVVRGLKEKPRVEAYVNAGIYMMEPSVHQCIVRGQPLDMTDLIQYLLDEGRQVISFPIREYWMDIGEPAEYEQASRDVRLGKVKV